MRNLKGFSLIELIVVITIVGVLSAIAIPVYKSYTERAQISVGRQGIESFEPMFLKYYASHGAFPIPEDLGLPAIETPASIEDYTVQPYVATIGMGTQATPGSCVFGNLYGYISNYSGEALTTVNVSAPAIIFFNYYIDVQGTMIKKCLYYELVNGDPTGRTNLVAGCLDMLDDDQMQSVTDIIENACD